MDADRFDTLAKRLGAPASRRATLGLAAAGGLLGALGFTKTVPELRAAQRGTCTLAFSANVRLGPSLSQPLVAGGQPGALRGELSFSLAQTGRLENGLLQLPSGESFPVVGQATGHAFNARIELAPRVALVVVGVGVQEVAACRGAIDGVAAGPEVGDLGDWHAAAVAPARGGQESGSGDSTRGDSARGSSGGAGRGTQSSNGDGRAPGTPTPRPTTVPAPGQACPEGQTRCGDDCVDTASDPDHCGACDEACADGVGCEGGRCTCEGSLTLCNGRCIDTATDQDHCGRCGAPCTSGDCIGGACTPTAPGPCAEQGASCATIDCCLGYCSQDEICECVSDGSECRADCCNGQPCSANGFCGTCATEEGAACASDADCCQGPSFPVACCAGVCTDVTASGVCPCAEQGASCATVDCCLGYCSQDEICECVSDGSECRAGCCNGQPCNADGYCGTCTLLGALCDSDAECCSGSYAALCCFDGVRLDTVCTDVTNIDFVCPGDAPALPPAAGCVAGFTDCGGACVDLSSHAGHCGACFNSCPLGGFCQGSACASLFTCAEGLTQCGVGPAAYCADVNFDSANCSACGVPCAPGLTCCSGFCKNLLTDAYNCGRCGSGACFFECENGVCT